MIRRALQAHTVIRSVTLLFTFGFQIIVAKVLTPDNYVTYALLLATLLVGERLLSFGIGRTVLRFVPRLLWMQDRAGLRVLALRLGLLRGAGLTLFVLALAVFAALHPRIESATLSGTTMAAFGVWFVTYTLLTDATAVAESLIAHREAALVAAGEALLRTAGLALLYVTSRSISVEGVLIVSAAVMAAALAALLGSLWLFVARRQHAGPGAPAAPDAAATSGQSRMPAFAAAAYASTLSYQISSPGVVRLVATAGLSVIDLAAYSFAQGISMALQRALPGMLILPSLEPVAAQMVERGAGARVLPALSLLFKVELTCVLAAIIVLASAGPDIIGLLSRPAYAPYYYILPILLAGVILHTVYRMLEILGSMHMTTRIFLTMWPLSLAAVAALYFTVGKWGLISVLVVPTAEIALRDAMLLFALRGQGVRQALDPGRSLRLILSAAAVLLGSSYVLARYGAGGEHVRVLVAMVGVGLFLATLLIVRPLRISEYEAFSQFVPASWRFPKYVARLLAGS